MVRALWPPVLGWAPVAIVFMIEDKLTPHGTALLAGMIMGVCGLVALVFCVVNIVRLARWQEMNQRLRLVLLLLNLSLPVAYVAGALLS